MIGKIIARLKQLSGITRSRAWRLYSTEYGGDELNICFIGSEIQKNFVLRALLPKSAKEQYLGVQYFHKLNPISASKPFDLIVAEKLSKNQLPRIQQQHWELPFWVHTYIDLPVTEPGNSFKSDLRLIRKNALEYRVSKDLSEIESFYADMYLPLVNQRYGDSGIPMHHSELIETVEKNQGELVLVLESGLPVAGMVIDYRGIVPNLWSVGVLNADRQLMKKAVIPATYHFSYQHLFEQGYSRASLGLCRPFIDDGVFKFKRKFRPRVLNATDRSFVLIPKTMSSALQALLIQNAFIQTKKGRLGLVTFLGAGENATDAQAAQSKRFADLELGASEVHSICSAGIKKESERSLTAASSLTQERSGASTPGLDRYSRAANYLLRHLINVKNEKSMLIYSDEQSDLACLDLIESAATHLGLKVVRLKLDSQKSIAEQSEQISQRLETSPCDLICEASGQYFYQTPSWRKALAGGTRAFSLGPLDQESLAACVGNVDHHKVFFLAERIAQIIEESRYLYLTDDNGSDLTIRYSRPLKNKVLSKVGLSKPHFNVVHKPTGILSRTINSTFLGGQLSFMGYPPDINGRLVIDGYLWPPKSVGALKNLVTLEIVKGKIVTVSGAEEARTFDLQQPLAQRSLEHICIGLNPGARMDKNLMEAERVMGACNFGFGQYPHHTDGVIAKPTLIADYTPVLENGTLREDL